jgi:Ras homolog enriched in brain
MILEDNKDREKGKTYDKSINQTASLLLNEDAFRPVKRRKIIILGAPGVGKSAIIMRFKDDIFLDYYEPTIQNVSKKSFYFNNQPTELEIVDIDGQTEYTIFSFSKLTFGIHGYIFCYSIENRQSFELLKILHAKLINLVGRDIPKILCANKSDLGNRREISVEEGKSLAKMMACPYIECSAKSNYNISRSFHLILTEIDRYENSGDIKRIGCKKLLEFFARKESLMTIIFYLLTALNFIAGTVFLVFGFYLGIISFVNNSVRIKNNTLFF